MQLTNDQETLLLGQYSGFLRRVAYRYYYLFGGSGKYVIDFEDILQEVQIVFLKHLRAVESVEKISPLPMNDFRHAVCLHVLGKLPVSVPRRTSNFRSVVKTYERMPSLDKMMEDGWDISGSHDGSFEEVEENSVFHGFMSRIPPEDAKFLAAYAASHSLADAGAAVGVSKSTASRKLRELKQKYIEDTRKTGKKGGVFA